MIKSHSNSKPGNLAEVCSGSQQANKGRSGRSRCWYAAKLQPSVGKIIMPKLSGICLCGSLNMHCDLSLGSGHLESLRPASVWQLCSSDGDAAPHPGSCALSLASPWKLLSETLGSVFVGFSEFSCHLWVCQNTSKKCMWMQWETLKNAIFCIILR